MRRFRVPYPYFRTLLAEVQTVDGLKDKKDGSGKLSTPAELKLLATLRVLGRGEVFDTAQELTNINEKTLRLWFHASQCGRASLW